MTTEQHEPVPAPQMTGPTPGSMLRAAREARGMTEQEVADSLKLRLSLVRDIEQDRFDQQTAYTFTKGYLRIYARLVGISEEAVVASYEGMGYVETPFAEMHSFSERTRREAREHRIRMASWAVVLLIIAGVLYWIIARPAEKPAVVRLDDKVLNAPASQNGKAPAAEPAANQAVAATTDATASAATAVAVPATTSAADTTSAAAPAATMSPAAAALVAAGADPAKVVPQTITTPTDSQTSAAPAANADSANAQAPAEQVSGDVVITFNGDCWLEVYDAKNKKLLSGTRRAGQHEALSGQAPFRMIIGAPKNVAITFKGEAVDMKRFPVGRVARFQLPLQK